MKQSEVLESNKNGCIIYVNYTYQRVWYYVGLTGIVRSLIQKSMGMVPPFLRFLFIPLGSAGLVQFFFVI